MYGKIVKDFKEEHGLSYNQLARKMWEKYPEHCPTKQAIEHWASERYYPDVFTLEALKASASSGEMKEFLSALIKAVYNEKVKECLQEMQTRKQGEKNEK